MKKFLAVILTAAMILSIASCGGKKEETTTAPETAPQVTEPETSEATEETTEAASEETTEEAPAEEEAPSEEENADETETQRLANAVLNSGVEFPATMFVDDPDMVKDMLGYDMADAEEYSIVTHLMSAHLVEITIIKVKDGKMDAVMEMLNKRKDDLLNNVAFYPAQVEAAEATVVGNKNGYAYLICDKGAAQAETALLEAIA